MTFHGHPNEIREHVNEFVYMNIVAGGPRTQNRAFASVFPLGGGRRRNRQTQHLAA